MKRRALLRALVGAPLLARAVKVSAAAAGEASFSIAFVTDTHIQPELNATEGVGRCFREVGQKPYDFVIHGGDHVFDAMQVGRERAAQLMNLYTETERQIGHRVHHVIGNHDCFGIFADSGVAESAPGYGKRYFTDRFGPTYYSFDHKGVHFVILDSIGLTADRNYEGRVDAGQLDWLRADLAKLQKATPIIVALHIPLVTALGCYEPLGWTNMPHNWTNVVNGREVLGVLRDHKVIAVLQGHGHVDETIILNGIPFITGGAVCGADWRGSFLGTREGYLHVDVSSAGVAARYIPTGFESVARRDVTI